jgi:phosphohistidine phosphatase
MRLYLFRHAEAANASQFSGPDEDRPLTAGGRDELARVLRKVRKDEKAPCVIYTSPLVRAVQTAEACAVHWSSRPDVRVSRALTPGAPVDAILREIEALGDAGGPLALVGHEPHLGHLLTRLTGSSSALSLPKAGIARVRFDPTREPPGEFVCLYAPGLKKPVRAAADL